MIMAHNWHEYLPVLHAVSLNESYTAWVGCCPSPIRLPWWVVKWLHSHGDWLRGIRQSKFLIVWGFFSFLFNRHICTSMISRHECCRDPVAYKRENACSHLYFTRLLKTVAGVLCHGFMFFLTFSTKRINERFKEKYASPSACLF